MYVLPQRTNYVGKVEVAIVEAVWAGEKTLFSELVNKLKLQLFFFFFKWDQFCLS